MKLYRSIIVFMFMVLCSPVFAMTATQKTLSTMLKTVGSSNGYGFLKALYNTTHYPCDLYFAKNSPEDFLFEKTTIRIKSLADGKYFSYRQQEGKLFSMKADTNDANDPATLFVVCKGMASDLTQRISLSPAAYPSVFLTYDAESKLLAFLPIDYAADENKQCHWSIETPYVDAPSRMDKVYLTNRLSGGCLTTYRGKDIVKLEPDQVKEESLGIVFGLARNSIPGSDIQPKSGDIIRLEHVATKKNLHSHAGWKSPVTGQQEVTAYGKDGQGDTNDNWTLTEVDGGVMAPGKTLKLIHVNTNCSLHSHSNKLSGDQQEVTGYSGRDDNDWWVVDEIAGGKELKYGSTIKLRHKSTGNVLHSDTTNYSHGGGSGQQRVTCYTKRDNNDWWIVNGPHDCVSLKTLKPGQSWEYAQSATNDPSGSLFSLIQLSVKDENDIWGVTQNGALFHFDGKGWTEEKLGAVQQWVSIADDGTVCAVGADKILRVKNPGGWLALDAAKKWAKVSVRNATEFWGISADDKQVYKITDQKMYAQQPLTGGAIDISVTKNGDVWAINSSQQVSRFDGAKWILIPSLKLTQISAINDKEVWGIGDGDCPYYWNGKELKKVADTPFSTLFAPSGTKKIVTVGRTEERMVEGASVVGSDGTLQGRTDAGLVCIEIAQLGMGGSIKPQSMTEYVALPMIKKPKVSGFADTVTEGSAFRLTPLLSKGVAWLETPITKGSATISFMAIAGDAGGAEIVFGQDMSTNFIYRITIGGWNNAKSGIIKRTVQSDLPQETLVAQVLPKEDPTNTEIPANPLARILPGQLMAYWVTIDNGLILVGMGNPGENIFMSWRDPNPPDNITSVGLATDTDSVDYSTILLSPPTVIEKVTQVYTTIANSPSPKKEVTWLDAPFRVSDSGAAAFNIQGAKQVAVLLGHDEDPSTEDYYQIVFGYKNNEGIAVQKWIASEARLKTISSITASSYKGIALDPQKKIPFWISYEYGQIMVGQGPIGKNLILCTKDIAPLEDIRRIGIASLSGASAAISNITICPQLSFALETSKESVSFNGKLTIISPFEYEFSQVGQSIKMEDLVNHLSFYVAGTPQQGSLYPFILSLDAMGNPKLDLYGKVTDEKYKEVQALITKGQAEIVAQRAKIASYSKSEAQVKDSFDKKVKEEQATAEEQKMAFTTVASVGQGLVMAGAMSRNVALAIAGIATSSAALATAVVAQNTLIHAAGTELEGKESQIALQKQALIDTAKAEQMEAAQALLSGQAKFSFRASDSYVYIDKIGRGDLGSAVITPEAAENAAAVKSLLSTLTMPVIGTFAAFISTAEKIILSITDLAVVADAAIRNQMYVMLQVMVDSYMKFFTDPSQRPAAIQSQIMNILMNAYNNTFLNNGIDPDEAAAKKAWISWINTLMAPYLTQSNIDITFEPMFGEYIWYPQAIGADKVTVTFKAKAANDIFIAFSPVNTAVRNTSTNIYEIDLGAWDDTKSVIRVKSLGRSAKAVSTEDLLNTLDYQTYWISYDNGSISVGTGDDPTDQDSVFLSWQDPYPDRAHPMKYIGFSCWDSPMTLMDIAVSSGQANEEASA